MKALGWIKTFAVWYFRALKDFSVFVCGTAVGALAMLIALSAVLLGGAEAVKAVARVAL